MKKVSLLFFLLSFYFGLNSQTPILQFSHSYSGNDPENLTDVIESIKIQGDTLFVSGTIMSMSDLGLLESVPFDLTDDYNYGLGVSIKYGLDDEYLSYISVGQSINDIFWNDNSNLYLHGSIFNSANFDLTGENPVMISSTNNFFNSYFCQYGSELDLSWLRYGNFAVTGICPIQDKLLIVGNYLSVLDLIGLNETISYTEDGVSNDAFILLVDNAGLVEDFKLFYTSSNEIFGETACSNVLGEFSSSGRLGGDNDFQWMGSENYNLSIAGETPCVLTYSYELELESVLAFISQSTGTVNSSLRAICYDGDGNLYCGGYLVEGDYILDLNGEQMDFDVNGGDELVIVKLNSNKELLWTRSAKVDGLSRFEKLYIDHSGFLNAVGKFDTFMNFEENSTVLNGAPESGFIARWTPEGELVWAHTISDGGLNSVNDICITPQNEMYIGGWFTTYSTDFDFSSDGSFDLGVTHGDDAFLAKYTISNPTPDVFVEQGWQTTEVTEAGATDAVYVRLSHTPSSPVQVIATPNAQLDLGNGQGVPVTLNFAADATAVQQQLLTVTAFDDPTIENLHSGLITFTINSSDSEFDALTENAINVVINDNDVIGVEELNSSAFSLSPNPATDQLMISFASSQQNNTINVFDESGKLVLSQQVNGTQDRVNISELAVGTYTLSIQIGKEKHTRMFLKR